MADNSKGKLQREGVPFPNKLTGPRARGSNRQSTGTPMQPRRHIVRERTPMENGMIGGTRDTTTVWETPAETQNRRVSQSNRSMNLRKLNPANAGQAAGDSVGMLEAEFLIAMFMLVLLFFTSSASYGDKVMSTMKRGFLTCVLFIILGLLSSAGPNMAKIAKAFGALVVVGLLLTSPTSTILSDLSALITNDWTGTGETGTDVSADNGTSASSSGSGGNTAAEVGGIAESAFNALAGKLGVPKGVTSTIDAAAVAGDLTYSEERIVAGIVTFNGTAIVNGAKSWWSKFQNIGRDLEFWNW